MWSKKNMSQNNDIALDALGTDRPNAIHVKDAIVRFDDPILITGAAGFIGSRVVEKLLQHGFRNLRCLIRPSGSSRSLQELVKPFEHSAKIEIVRGNLLSKEDCERITRNIVVVYHLAAGT